MSRLTNRLTGTHKTQLLSDGIHAVVVLVVVCAASILAVVHVGLPPDVLGTVYGGAIGYAAGRAGNVARGPSPTESGLESGTPTLRAGKDGE